MGRETVGTWSMALFREFCIVVCRAIPTVPKLVQKPDSTVRSSSASKRSFVNRLRRCLLNLHFRRWRLGVAGKNSE
jgi:hypothetical protein